MTINERVKYLRKIILKKTQQAFSEEIKISRSNLGNIETGEVAVTERVLSSICEKFNVNEEWLRTGKGEVYKKIEDETAAIVSELLEKENPFYDMILKIMKTYQGLDEKSQTVLKKFSKDILDNMSKEN